MKKTITLFLILLTTTILFSQTDSTKSKIGYNVTLAISSRNYSRGINYGDGISLQPTAELFYKNTTVGIFGSLTDNRKYNYGTTYDLYLAQKIKNFTICVHDYFYVNKVDSLNDFLFETGKGYIKDTNLLYHDGHYLEFMIKYSGKKLSALAAYNFYNTTCNIYNSTVYLEAEYRFVDSFSAVVGFTTGASNLNFYTDKYNKGVGFTCIGINWIRAIKISDKFSTDLKIQAHVNPNYKNIAPGLQVTPFNLIVSLTF